MRRHVHIRAYAPTTARNEVARNTTTRIKVCCYQETPNPLVCLRLCFNIVAPRPTKTEREEQTVGNLPGLDSDSEPKRPA